MAIQTIGVVGLGYVGQPMVAAMANVGYQVVGMDIDSKKVSELSDTYLPTVYEPGVAETFSRCRDRISFTDSFEELMHSCSAVFITVGTPLDEQGGPDISFLSAAIQNLGRFLKKGQLLVLRSTVAPGTTMRMAEDLEKLSGLKSGVDFYLSFCPERTIEGIALHELYNLPNIIGGITQKSSEMTKAVMERLGTRVIITSSPTVAELCKLTDNMYRALNIAFANEMGSVCEKANVDAYEIVNTVNQAYSRTSIFRPGLGADGPCLSKDPLILRHFAQSAGLETPVIDGSVKVNEAATNRVTDEVENFLNIKKLKAPKVAFLGLAFKGMPETDDMRGSAAVTVYAGLENSKETAKTHQVEYSFYDPLVRKFNGHHVDTNFESCIEGANVVLFLSDHPSLRNIPLGTVLEQTARPLLVVDSWHNVASLDRAALPSDVTYVRIGDGR